MTIYAKINSQGYFQLSTQNHKDVFTFTDCKNVDDLAKINDIIKTNFYKRMMDGERTFSIKDYVDDNEETKK